jgi:hypothetical protein
MKSLRTEAISPGECRQDVARIGGVFLQLATESRDMGVDRPAAHGGACPPHLAQQLDARGDCSPPPHQRQQQPEFGVSHSDWLTASQNSLSGRLEHDAPESDRAGPPGGCARRHGPGPMQQLLHASDQLSDHRSIRATVVDLAYCGVIGTRFGREWRANLKLVYHRKGA